MNKIILIIVVIIIGISSFVFWQNRYVINNVINTTGDSNTIPFGNASLDLSNQGLKSIPFYVFNQTNLEELNVSNNQLTGAIQAEIRQLVNLKILNASNNLMTGLPAEIGQLQKLEILDVSNNKLTGLPHELGNLKSLKVLNLSGNQYSKQDLDYIRSKLPSTVYIIVNAENATNAVLKRVGDKEFNFLIQKINAGGVGGLWYVWYPVAMDQGQPKTLHVGDSVGYACEGKTAIVTSIDANNQTVTFKETITNPPPYGCPICLASNTTIDTPNGQVNVKGISVGDMVWSINEQGQKVAVPVLKVSSTLVPKGHQVVHVVLTDNRQVFASPNHPIVDGRPISQLRVGDRYNGSKVQSVELLLYWDSKTYDILPQSDTGEYWANGILLKSTLQSF